MGSADVVQPWERQENEPELAYEAFKGYCFQTIPRRLAHSSVKHSAVQLTALYNEWRWADRVLAWDRHVDRLRLAEREALLKQGEKERLAKQMVVLETMGELIDREIAKHAIESKASQMSATKLADLNKLVNTWITMSRLIHGQSTENVEVQDARVEKLTIEELLELQRLHAKMAEGDGEEEKVH